jgi:hypothetical protein
MTNHLRTNLSLSLSLMLRPVCLGIKHPSGVYDQIFITVRQLRVCWFSDERTGLSFTIDAGLRQRSHSRVRVPWDSRPYFTASDSRLPQPGGLGPRIYISQEQDVPVISPGSLFSFRRLLRLAGLRWKYSTPPPHGSSTNELLCTAAYIV